MFVRTPRDLGAIIRDNRKKRGLGQADLARQIGVSRQWIIGVEQGRARAALGLVLKTLNALDLRLDAAPTHDRPPAGPDIDAIVADAQKSKR